MAMTLSQMVSRVRRICGEDINDISDDDIEDYLNDSYEEILSIFHFREKEYTASIITVPNNSRYEVPSPFEAIRQISITDIYALNHYVLDRWTPITYEDNATDDQSENDIPRKYVREGCMFRLWPTPDLEYTLTVKFWALLGDLSNTNPQTPIPQEWHEIIVYGGAWRRLGDKRDTQGVTFYKNLQASLINTKSSVETKEESDSKTAHLNVRRSESGNWSSRTYR